MAKRKKPRPVNSYLNAAKNLAKFAPSLAKYKRRKTLNRWEKAAITRREKIIGRTENLYALSKRQVKALDKSSRQAIVGNGVRAVRFRNTSSETKIGVEKGKFVTKEPLKGERKKRRIRYIPVPPDLDLLIEKAVEIFERADRLGHIITVWLWVQSGRASGGFRSLRLLLDKLNENWIAYALTDERFRGYAILRDN